MTLAAERADWRVVATDVSAVALDVARHNADQHGVGARVTFVEGDLLAPVEGPIDGIVANPPYVAQRDAPGLSRLVAGDGARVEPDLVLIGLASAAFGRGEGWAIDSAAPGR